jgi:hypothetical protein
MSNVITTDQVQEQLVKLQVFLEEAKNKWNEQNPLPKTWYDKNKVYIVSTTSFLISVTDKLINFVETFILKGSDKKIAVLSIVAQLFDYIASKAFPFWLQPFVPVIKQIVVSIIISNLIEFIVVKYRDGSWNWEKKSNVPTIV